MAKINWKNKDEVRKYRREWRQKHSVRLNKEAKEYHQRNPEMSKKVWDNQAFGGNKQLVLERDNFECQECGMSQQQHIILFNFQLIVHHKDGQGRRADDVNNDMDNLITLCVKCHGRIHREIFMMEKYGELLEQDDSEWEYPKIRELVEAQIKNGFGIQESKRIVSKETGIGFSSIDHKYYKKKHDVLLGDSA